MNRRHSTKHRDRAQKVGAHSAADRAGDEWIECGENLEILPAERQRVRIPRCSAMQRVSRHRGSAFAAQSVCGGVHFWKIKVFCGDHDFGFAVGFVPDRGGANRRNGACLGTAGSVGISGDGGVWNDGKKVSGTKGVAMRNMDIINLALDMERGQVLVQRIEYRRSTEYQYTVHCAKKLAAKRTAIAVGGGSGYRLG